MIGRSIIPPELIPQALKVQGWVKRLSTSGTQAVAEIGFCVFSDIDFDLTPVPFVVPYFFTG